MKTIFFDTYAFVEILDGNPAYSEYTENIAIITSIYNLVELHYAVLRTKDQVIADDCYRQFEEFAVPIGPITIKLANEFRLRHKDKKLSYADCLGYTMAKMHGVPFLTGDEAFKTMDNVIFVK